MKIFDKILCPIDFSEDSIKTLQWAELAAKKYGSQVTILHVMEPYPAAVDIGIDYDRYHATVLRDMQNFLEPLKIHYESIQSSGVPSQKIVALAKALGASVIVMGTRGLRGAAHKLVGSTTESVIRNASVPVITLSPHVDRTSGPQQERILLPVSSLTFPARGYIRLRKIVRDLDAAITLFHVVDLKDAMFGSSFSANPVLVTTYETAEKKEDLLRIGRQIAKNATTTDAIVQFGDCTTEIGHESESGKYGFVLMGAKRQTILSRFIESKAYVVISESRVPVITIRVN